MNDSLVNTKIKKQVLTQGKNTRQAIGTVVASKKSLQILHQNAELDFSSNDIFVIQICEQY